MLRYYLLRNIALRASSVGSPTLSPFFCFSFSKKAVTVSLHLLQYLLVLHSLLPLRHLNFGQALWRCSGSLHQKHPPLLLPLPLPLPLPPPPYISLTLEGSFGVGCCCSLVITLSSYSSSPCNFRLDPASVQQFVILGSE